MNLYFAQRALAVWRFALAAKVFSVTASDKAEFVALLELFKCVVAGDLKQTILWLLAADIRVNERLCNEAHHCVCNLHSDDVIARGDCNRRLEEKFTCKNCKPT